MIDQSTRPADRIQSSRGCRKVAPDTLENAPLRRWRFSLRVLLMLTTAVAVTVASSPYLPELADDALEAFLEPALLGKSLVAWCAVWVAVAFLHRRERRQASPDPRSSAGLVKGSLALAGLGMTFAVVRTQFLKSPDRFPDDYWDHVAVFCYFASLAILVLCVPRRRLFPPWNPEWNWRYATRVLNVAAYVAIVLVGLAMVLPVRWDIGAWVFWVFFIGPSWAALCVAVSLTIQLVLDQWDARWNVPLLAVTGLVWAYSATL